MDRSLQTTIAQPELSYREFKSFQRLIHELAGISLADSKQVMVQGRLARRLRELNFDSYRQYWEFLSSNEGSSEIPLFINALTTNKTDFFREKHHFEFLTKTFLPQMVERAKQGGPKRLRIWCSASSTGEEPYTIAMTVREFFGNDSSWDIRILASDIDTAVLKRASDGIYTADRVAEIPRDLLTRYFERETRDRGADFQVKPSLRDLITFRQINLQDQDWPIYTLFDLIFCRNVMIYFGTDLQAGLVKHFAETLQPRGYLIIGHSESLSGLTDDYELLGNTIYRKVDQGLSTPRINSSLKTRAVTAKESGRKDPRGDSIHQPLEITEPAFDARGAQPSDPKHPIIVGEVHVSHEPVWITTILGSCVAVCMYDEVLGIGGMNHFMLLESKTDKANGAYLGIHAMELLINEIMKQGGERRRLKAKFFGGASVVKLADNFGNVGKRNVQFAEDFLKTNGIPIIAQHTGGGCGMSVQFHSVTAKVFVQHLDRNNSVSVDREQRERGTKFFASQLQSNDITLFEE
jgi:chemotaxis protein methyltransferase CheR